MLRIFGKASSINVRKVLWTCAELSLPYEREDWGSGFRQTDSPEFLARNPNGLVPVIEDGNGVLWESNSICRYLARSAGAEELLPPAPRTQALVEHWMDWQATELNGAWRYAFVALVRRQPGFDDPVLLASSIREWNAMMGVLDRQLAATGAFVVGANFTLADVVLGLSVNRWLMTPIDRPAFPAVMAYHARLLGRPGYVAYGCNGIP